ncbi:MAG: PilT/PilU family type 4a pilus ATPase, partial [Dehalococcoidales bacterium]|nr:PilT/PilU family type 4a pilus ATPase [Dehalococcoidales bacterium]
QQRGTISMAFRVVPFKILTIDELSLPQICKQLIHKPRGMILVTGPTGSGKSTTMAAMIDYLNETKPCNIITIEDPIEYLHRNKKSLIAQRDLGDDTKSFNAALVHSLRQDPDVIVIGEMRDIDTMSIAIRAAETGHLVLGTLHTRDATQTIDRIIDMFPSSQQAQIRIQVSQSIEGILSQALLPKNNGKGRAAAFEIMLANSAVRNLIRDGRTYELPNVIQLNNKDGMITLDQSLAELVAEGMVAKEEALSKSSNPERLEKILQFKAGGGYTSKAS